VKEDDPLSDDALNALEDADAKEENADIDPVHDPPADGPPAPNEPNDLNVERIPDDADFEGADRLGIDVQPPGPVDEVGFLNPDGIRDARPIELLGLGGRMNAFFSTIISVTVFNIALISTIFWLPTIVGHIMTYSRSHLYRYFEMAINALLYVWDSPRAQMGINYISETLSFILFPLVLKSMELFQHGIYHCFDIDIRFILNLLQRVCERVMVEQPVAMRFLTDHPMIFGYLTLITLGLVLLLLDMAYYHFKRPSIVKRRRKLRATRSSEEIPTFWVFVEEISRIHTVFWRLIDSALRVYDFAFQLMIMPYFFGRGVAMASLCICTPQGVLSEEDANSSRVLSESSLDSLAYITVNTPIRDQQDPEMSDQKRFLLKLEENILMHLSYWMVGFWYVYCTMKIFSNARFLMRIEFNACWMRFPQPNQIPISLSIVRAMKERVISMRIHVPLIVLGIHIPCKLMLRLFPSAFPVTISPLNLHKWPTAGMLFMLSCFIATVMRRLKVRRRLNRFAASWLDTVTFALGIQYLVVPGAEPPEDLLLELDDPEAQRLFMPDRDEEDDRDRERERDRNGDRDRDRGRDANGRRGDGVFDPFPQDMEGGRERANVPNQLEPNVFTPRRMALMERQKMKETEEMKGNEEEKEEKKMDDHGDDDAMASPRQMTPSQSLLSLGDTTKAADVGFGGMTITDERKDNGSNGNGNGDGTELEEEIKKLREENLSLKAQIEEKNARKKELKVEDKRRVRRLRKLKKRKRKRKRRKQKRRRDDIFLAPHPWENPNDVYLRLHEERRQYVERCSLYTVGTAHLRLRIFAFVLSLWMTWFLASCCLFLAPLVVGRLVVESWLSTMWYTAMRTVRSTTNADCFAYFVGIVVMAVIPNEIHCVLSYHLRGTLATNLKKTVIRLFLFVAVPCYIGYGWNAMIYHFLHSVSVTPVYCLLELYCTGVYITIIYVLFQDQQRLQNVLLWIQNNRRADLRAFCRQFAIPTLRFLILHISVPIALRWMLMRTVHDEQHLLDPDVLSGAAVAGGAVPSRSTVIIDLDSISNGFSEDEMDVLQRSVLQLEPILMDRVFLHYNHYELGLFLESTIWQRLYEFVFVDFNWNLLTFLVSPFHETRDGVVIANWYLLYRFLRFVVEFILLKCPIPFVIAVRVLIMLFKQFVDHIPKIKDIILQERYSGSRKLLNLPAAAKRTRNSSDQRNQDDAGAA